MLLACMPFFRATTSSFIEHSCNRLAARVSDGGLTTPQYVTRQQAMAAKGLAIDRAVPEIRV